MYMLQKKVDERLAQPLFLYLSTSMKAVNF